jgi:hypothetical protein
MRRRRSERENRRPIIDRWFRALDQRRIRAGAAEWRIQVTGIHVSDRDVWIQMAGAAEPSGSVLLCVAPTTSVDRAVRALRTGSAFHPSAYPTVVHANVKHAHAY